MPRKKPGTNKASNSKRESKSTLAQSSAGSNDRLIEDELTFDEPETTHFMERETEREDEQGRQSMNSALAEIASALDGSSGCDDSSEARALVHTTLHPRKRALLAAYSVCGSIERSCQLAGVSRTAHYLWMSTDAEYAFGFGLAREALADRLEQEAVFRATEGLRKYKFDKYGAPILHPVTNEPYFEVERDTLLLMFLLKGLRPQMYRERNEARNAEQMSDAEIDAELAVLYARNKTRTEAIETTGKDVV